MKNPFEISAKGELHAKVLPMIMERFRISHNRMTEKHKKWKAAEDLFRAYMPETEADARARRRTEAGVPTYKTIYVPYSYAMALSAHTYATSVFLGRDPVFQYQGRHGETQHQVQAVEALIDYNYRTGEMAPPAFVWFLDAIKYGLGVVESTWAEENVAFAQFVNERGQLGGIEFGEPQWFHREEMVSGYSGNKISNVRPYDFFPDPRVSFIECQRGEFMGRTTLLGKHELRRMPWLFNLDDIPSGQHGEFAPSNYGSPTNMLPVSSVFDIDALRQGYVGILRMVIDLDPREWGLPGTLPAKWEFTIANNYTIIGARPCGYRHGKFPYDVISYEVDGYDVAPRGMMDVTNGLNDLLNWLVNTHFYSVRKSLNGSLIIDPSKLVMQDLLDGGPGRLVRMRPEAYGQDIRTAYAELIMTDPTRGHLADTSLAEGLLQRVTGANDTFQGVPSRNRRTATEVRSTEARAAGRLKTFCDFASALGFSKLSAKLIANCQQFYQGGLKLRIAGDLLTGPRNLEINPQDITGGYDWVPVDGTLPVDRFAQATLWKEIFMVIGRIPQIAMGYDIVGIFAHMAQLAGLKNITQFRITPDQQMRAMAQAGNVVPISAGKDGVSGPSPSAVVPTSTGAGSIQG